MPVSHGDTKARRGDCVDCLSPGRLPFSQKSDDERVIQSPDLAASPRDVTNSYKFYWLLAIQDAVREGGGVK